MSAFKAAGRRIIAVKVPTRDGEWRNRTTGTQHIPTGRKMQAMLRELGPEGMRAWDVLDAVLAGTITVAELWDCWNETGRDVAAVRARLGDLDLEPLVATFAHALANRKHVRADTAAHYVAAVRTLIPAGQGFPRSRLTRAALRAWLDSKAGLSPSTIRKHGIGVRIFCEWLVERGTLAENPMQRLKLPAQTEPRSAHLDTADAIRLADAQPAPFRAFSALLHATGIDVTTALGLRRRDVNVADRTIRAPGSKNYNRDRVVRVAEWAWSAYVAPLLAGLTPDAPLFAGIPDRWVAMDRHRAACEALVAQGHRIFRGYWQRDARHTWAVRAIRGGWPVEAVARQLGHKDGTLVMKVYGRFIPKREEIERYEKLATAAEKRRQEAK